MNVSSDAFDFIPQVFAWGFLILYFVWFFVSFLGLGESPSTGKHLAEVDLSKRGRLKSGRMSGFRRRTEPPAIRRPSRPTGR